MTQWDDDDWHATARLDEQVAEVWQHNRPACVLSQWITYAELSGAACLSQKRTCEGSLVAEVSALPANASLRKAEDTRVIEQMTCVTGSAALNQPSLYGYAYHGRNTRERSHWRRKLVRMAQPLTADQSAKVGELLCGVQFLQAVPGSAA